jgi:hypothetical protein
MDTGEVLKLEEIVVCGWCGMSLKSRSNTFTVPVLVRYWFAGRSEWRERSRPRILIYTGKVWWKKGKKQMQSGAYREPPQTEEYTKEKQKIIEAIAKKTGWPAPEFKVEIDHRTKKVLSNSPSSGLMDTTFHRVVISREGTHRTFSGAEEDTIPAALSEAYRYICAASPAKLRQTFGELYLVKAFKAFDGPRELQHLLNAQYNNGYTPMEIISNGSGDGLIIFKP